MPLERTVTLGWSHQIHRVDEDDLLTGALVPVVQREQEPAAEVRPVVALERIAEALERIVQWQTRPASWAQAVDGPGGGRRLIPSLTPGRQWSRNVDGGNRDRLLQLTGAATSLPARAATLPQEMIACPPSPANNGTASIEAQLNEIRDLLKKQEKLIRPVERKFYSVEEAAELTGYKAWTIRHACAKGRVKGHKGDDGRWRLPHEEVTRLQEEGLAAE